MKKNLIIEAGYTLKIQCDSVKRKDIIDMFSFAAVNIFNDGSILLSLQKDILKFLDNTVYSENDSFCMITKKIPTKNNENFAISFSFLYETHQLIITTGINYGEDKLGLDLLWKFYAFISRTVNVKSSSFLQHYIYIENVPTIDMNFYEKEYSLKSDVTEDTSLVISGGRTQPLFLRSNFSSSFPFKKEDAFYHYVDMCINLLKMKYVNLFVEEFYGSRSD